MTSTIALIAIVLIVAWALDRWRRRRIWGKKSTEELTGILAGTEWRKWELALRELKRRGHDVSSAVPRLAGPLLSGSKWERAAARIVLMNTYPETRPLLKNYRPADDEVARRRMLEPFFSKHGVKSGG